MPYGLYGAPRTPGNTIVRRLRAIDLHLFIAFEKKDQRLYSEAHDVILSIRRVEEQMSHSKYCTCNLIFTERYIQYSLERFSAYQTFKVSKEKPKYILHLHVLTLNDSIELDLFIIQFFFNENEVKICELLRSKIARYYMSIILLIYSHRTSSTSGAWYVCIPTCFHQLPLIFFDDSKKELNILVLSSTTQFKSK